MFCEILHNKLVISFSNIIAALLIHKLLWNVLSMSSADRDRFQVFDVAARGLLRVEELEDQGQTLANVFILRLLENAHEREFTYMLKASSQ